METTVLLPTAGEVRDLIEGLLGRDVTVRSSANPLVEVDSAYSVGCYEDDGGQPRILTLTDLSLAACVGAALSLVPKGRVEEAMKSGQLSDELAGNFHEILNVSAALVNGDGRPHLRFTEVYGAVTPVPPAVIEAGRSAKDRVDCTLEIRGYGGGSFTMLAV